MERNAKIYVAGHTGLVGSTLLRALRGKGFTNLITCEFDQLDLRNQHAVNSFFALQQPDYVFLAAAKVGGIHANNTYRAEFLYDNVMIQANVIHAAYQTKVKKLLFLGSSCIYPRKCPQPIREDYLLTGPLESTNEPYAIAKIAGLKLIENYNKQYRTNFIACMPTNLYGPRDNFNLETSHVIPALIAKIHQAHLERKPTITLWGTGQVRREFLFIEDLADALIFLMHHYTGNRPLNIGTSNDITIKQLAVDIANIIGYQGTILYDHTMPDGTPQKLLDTSKINALGWQATTSLTDGLHKTIDWYQKDYSTPPLHSQPVRRKSCV